MKIGSAVTAALCLAVLATARPAAAEETVLRAITYAPPNKVEDSMVIFKKWMDRVNAAGKGQVKVDLIGGPEVVPVPDQVNAVSKGIADIVMTFGVQAPLVPESDTTGLSDITPAEERKVGYLDLLDEAHKKINIKVIGRTSTNSGFFIFSKDPIHKLDDFRGMKIRSHSGYDPLFKMVGAVPIGMQISEIYTGLERGVVRAAPYPLFVYDMGLQDVTKYALGDGFWISHTTATYMNLRKWQSLGSEKQKILMDAQLAEEAEMGKIVEDMKAAEQAKLEKAGMIFTHLSPEEAKKWRRMANDTRFNALADKISPDQMARIKSMIVRQ